MPDIKVIVPDDLDGTTVRLNQAGKVEAVINQEGSGLNHQSIPDKEFVKGSKVLAFDPDGNLYQFGQNSDYFKDGALALYTVSSELQSDGSTQHTVRITVTNVLNNTIPKATVNVSSGNPISDFVLESSNADSAVWENSSLVITNLSAYGSVSAQVHVTNSYNDYVSASLDIDGDVVTTNNHVTVNLQHKVAPPATSNAYTKECPLITATFGSQQLSQTTQTKTPLASYLSFYDSMFINMIDQKTLNGATVTFDGASSVRVFLSDAYYNNGRFTGAAVVKELEQNKYRSWAFCVEDYHEATTVDYTFSDGVLVFNTEVKSAIIFVRTGGSECMWQRYYIGTLNGDTTLTINDNHIGVTGLDQKYYHYNTTGTAYGGDKFKDLPAIESSDTIFTNLTGVRYFTSADYWASQDKYTYYMTYTSIDAASKLIIEIPRGTQASFKIERDSILPSQQGAVHTDRDGNVVVSTGAMPTDSVYTDLVDIVIT